MISEDDKFLKPIVSFFQSVKEYTSPSLSSAWELITSPFTQGSNNDLEKLEEGEDAV